MGLGNVELAVVGVLVPRTALGNRENRRNVADAAVVAYCRHTNSNEDMRLSLFDDVDQKYSQ